MTDITHHDPITSNTFTIEDVLNDPEMDTATKLGFIAVIIAGDGTIVTDEQLARWTSRKTVAAIRRRLVAAGVLQAVPALSETGRPMLQHRVSLP